MDYREPESLNESRAPDVQETLSSPARSSFYELLLSKYVGVWLWSAIFGVVSGVLFTLITFRSYDSKWRAFTLLAALLTGIGGVAAISSLLSLYRGLRYFLIPHFILNEKPDPVMFASSLRAAVLGLILASCARLLISLSELIISSLSGGGF